VTSDEFRTRLLERAAAAGVSITAGQQLQLEAYFQLLTQWNAKINLTALPLRQPTNQTFDRLLIEPLVSARYVGDSAHTWFDVGSGGGSPAIPLKIAHPRAKLTMVESKARKAAFLREAVRAAGFTDVAVENHRFEQLARRTEPQTIDLVTMRGVKGDPLTFSSLHHVLAPSGRVFLYHSSTTKLNPPAAFVLLEKASLGTSTNARLDILKPVFHVEQSG